MKDNISPEEKLLRLIRGPKKSKPVSSISTSMAATYPAEPVKPPVGALPVDFFKKYVSSDFLNKGIFFIFCVSAFYLLLTLIAPLAGWDKAQLPKFKPQTPGEIEAILKPGLEPYEFYQKALSNRQIFTTPNISAEPAAKSASVEALVKDITLMGIMSGDSPQAILEDQKTHKTYYLNKGQYIGEFQVEDIQDGKVILNYKGQRSELYL